MAYYRQLYSGNQGGYGFEDIELYRGPVYRQRGAGFGSFLRNSYKYLQPLLNSGVNAITNQGLKSASSVLSQLGKKNLNTILSEEGEKIVQNLSDSAIKKIRRLQGNVQSNQSGSGLTSDSLSPFTLKNLSIKRQGRKRKGIKTRVKKRIGQMYRRRKVGGTRRHRTKKRQIGGGRRKRKTRKNRANFRKRQLELFQ